MVAKPLELVLSYIPIRPDSSLARLVELRLASLPAELVGVFLEVGEVVVVVVAPFVLVQEL